MNLRGKNQFLPPLDISQSEAITWPTIDIPICIFKQSLLSGLEVICKFLKEELSLSFRDIALLLNRNERTIWHAYSSSVKKSPEKLTLDHSPIAFPTLIIANRSLSVLESICEYLKDFHQLRYCQIAPLLSRNERTVWTVYNRAKKKRKMEVAN